MENARWWAVRRAQSRRPATYYCPFCQELLHATSEHVLIAPEGDANRRRHAHMACVLAARSAGTFVTYDDWRLRQPSAAGRLRRLFRRGGGRRPPPPNIR